MKIWTMSDLHLDWYPDDAPVFDIPEHDVFVIAGDLSNGDFDVIPWLMQLPESVRERTIYVPGNHDYWHLGLHKGKLRLWDIASKTGITVLDNQRTVISGQGFVGSTLWSALDEDPYVERDTLDLVNIPNFTAADYRGLHEEAVYYIDSETMPGDVVITHHAPDRQGVRMDFFQNPRMWTQRSSQYSVLGELVGAVEPLTWIHGHTHIRKDYEVRNVKVHTAAVDAVGVVVDVSGYKHRPPGYN